MPDKKEEEKSTFENGNTKIYVSTQTLRYCSIRRIIQIGCYNSRTSEQVHLVSKPGPLKQYASHLLLQYLKWRDVESEKPWFRKEGDVRLDCVSDILQEFINFIKKESKENAVTLVFYSTAEYHELAAAIKENPNLAQEFKKIVQSIVIYEHYKYKVNEKAKDFCFKAIDKLLDVKIRVYSCDKLAELLRQLFVESQKKEEDFYPLKPDFDRIPRIQVSYPRLLWNSQPKYLLLSSIRVDFSRFDWKEEQHPLPRECYKKVCSTLESTNTNCVTAFGNGMFRCNQPVIVKFKDLKEDTKSISYKGKILDFYTASGSCTLYTYNNVYFALVVFQFNDKIKDITDLSDSDYVQDKGYVDNELDVYARVLDPDKEILEFTEKSEEDISVKDNTRKFDLVVADILEQKHSNVAIRRNILKSVLVKLKPVGQNKNVNEDVSISVFSTFMASYSTSQYKGLKIVNQIFCSVKDNSNLARLILTSTGEDFTLNAGNTIGLATPINQSNFSEVLIQAFQHEIDVNDFLIDPFVKKRREDAEHLAKQNNRKQNKTAELENPPALKKKRNRKFVRRNKKNEAYDYGGRKEEDYINRDDVYGSRERDEIYGSRDEIYGSRDETYGSREDYSRSQEKRIETVDVSDLGMRRQDLDRSGNQGSMSREYDRDDRRKTIGRSDLYEDTDSYHQHKKRSKGEDWYDKDLTQGGSRSKYDEDFLNSRNVSHNNRQMYDSQYPQSSNFSQPPPSTGYGYKEDIGQRRH